MGSRGAQRDAGGGACCRNIANYEWEPLDSSDAADSPESSSDESESAAGSDESSSDSDDHDSPAATAGNSGSGSGSGAVADAAFFDDGALEPCDAAAATAAGGAATAASEPFNA
ncbi:MAG: hypothetical protein WB990_04245, partial [Candidatus Acidiferrales bacterium]